MSRKMRSKRIVGCLLVLAIAGAIGMAPSKVQAQMLTPTMAVRFGAADESGDTTDMDVAPFDGKTYLAVLEQRTTIFFPWRPVPPDGPIIPAPRTTSSASGDAEPSGWPPAYKQIRVLRVIDVTTEPWVELFSMELDHAVAVEFVELADGQVLVAVLAVNDLDKLVFYDLNGAEVGETALPEAIEGYPVTAYNAFDVAYTDGDIDLQPLIFVVGSAMNADGIPCVACVAPDGSGGFMVACKKTYPEFEGEALTKVSAATDGTSAFLVCLSQAAQFVRNRILEIRCINGEDGGTVSSLLISEDPLTEFPDLVAVVDVARDVRTYYALANEKTSDGGTRAALYYWKVDEFAAVYTGSLCIAEPDEPGGHVEGKCLAAGSDVWGNSDTFHYLYAAGNTDGPILGGPQPLGGSDVWFAALEFDPIYTGLLSMSPAIELYGSAGDDTLGAMAAGRPSDAVKKKASRCVYLAFNTDSLYPIDVGNFTLQAVGGMGTDPTIIELKTPAAMIGDLITKVESMNLHQGIDNSLDVKLENAMKSLESLNAGNRQDAVNKLQAFVNECVAQSGNKLSASQAQDLIGDTLRIIAALH